MVFQKPRPHSHLLSLGTMSQGLDLYLLCDPGVEIMDRFFDLGIIWEVRFRSVGLNKAQGFCMALESEFRAWQFEKFTF